MQAAVVEKPLRFAVFKAGMAFEEFTVGLYLYRAVLACYLVAVNAFVAVYMLNLKPVTPTVVQHVYHKLHTQKYKS